MSKVMSMRGPALTNLKRVALIIRDQVQNYPRAELSALLASENIELLEGPNHDDVDLVIAMGGDGTVLQALSAYPLQPTLAINFGRVGFLTQGDRDQLIPLLHRLLRGDYFIEHRLAIEVSVYNQGVRSSSRRCINEVVLKGIAHINEITLSIDGDEVHTCRGDGMIIGTPTGSTAYLMSTGAPLVTPGVNCLIASPLNEYSFSSRPMILPGESELMMRIDHARPQDLMLIVDGETPQFIEKGTEIYVSRSIQPTLLVAFEPQFFFHNLRERLHWG